MRETLSEAPGVNQMGRIGNAPGLVYEQANVAPKSRTPHREIGYGYRVTFDVEGAAETPGTELFRSPDAVFYLSDPIRGMLGFARDGYLNTFSYNIQPGQRLNIGIEGDNKATRLFINGKLVEELNIQQRFFDKEGKTWEERGKYFNKLKSICERYKNKCKMGFIYDSQNLLELKESPFDKGSEIFKNLMKKGVWI
jgi:hexosaminidase